MNETANVATTEEIEIVISEADDKPKFKKLPWRVLAPEAFEASQAHIYSNFGRAPMAMAILAARSGKLGHSLTESEYRELVQMDEIPEEHEMCSYPGCSHKVSSFRTALVIDGEVLKNRDGETTWRGNFLLVKLAEGGLTVLGFCNSHLVAARKSAEDACGEKLHPMPYAVAVARRQGILDAFRRRQEAAETFESRLAGSKSIATRGRYGSAPRNPGDMANRRSGR